MKNLIKKFLVISALTLIGISSQNASAQDALNCQEDFWFKKHPLSLRPGETVEKTFDMRGCSQACFSFVSAVFPEIKGKTKIISEVIADGKPAVGYENLYPLMQREVFFTFRFSLPQGAKPISTYFQTRFSYMTCWQ